MMKKILNVQKAFTLLEILLVTVVIAIMTVALIAFLKHYALFVMQKRTASDIEDILDQAVLYHLYHDVWPLQFTDLVNAGTLTASQQCSPWNSSKNNLPDPCNKMKHQNYIIETTDKSSKQFVMSLTLEHPDIINALSGKIPNSSVVNDTTLQISVVSPELIQSDTGTLQKFGYTRDDDSGKDGNGKTITFNPCPSGVPVVFHVPYRFNGPHVKLLHVKTGVWGLSKAMAYPGGASYTINNPPTSAKLCTINTTGSAVSGSVMNPGKSARHRYFTTCLSNDIVKDAYAPPYGSFNAQGNNVMQNSDDYDWCVDL